jgi:peptidyl-prolyl cis-trans isomerase SurA
MASIPFCPNNRVRGKGETIAKAFQHSQAAAISVTDISVVIFKEQNQNVYQSKIKTSSLALIAALMLSVVAACDSSTGSGGSGSGKGATDPTVAATVNGKKIMMSEVDRLLNSQAGGQQSQLSQLELAQARLQVLNGLIQQEVLFQRAEKEKFLPSEDDVNQAIATLKQQGNLTEDEYQRRLQERGQTEQGIREEVRRQIALEKLQSKYAANVGTIRDKEVDDFYEANKAQFVKSRGVSLAAIIVDPRDNGAQDDAKSPTEATVKANNIYDQIKGGADFATVARARSEDQTNVNGGDLGFLPEEQMKQTGFPPELIQRFFAMSVGDITQPIATPDGRLTIFKLQNKRLENENLTRENPEARDSIKRTLTERRQSLLNAVMIEVAMNEADIVNNLARGVLDNPGDLSGIRPANANAAQPDATPAASASPAAATCFADRNRFARCERRAIKKVEV